MAETFEIALSMMEDQARHLRSREQELKIGVKQLEEHLAKLTADHADAETRLHQVEKELVLLRDVQECSYCGLLAKEMICTKRSGDLVICVKCYNSKTGNGGR